MRFARLVLASAVMTSILLIPTSAGGLTICGVEVAGPPLNSGSPQTSISGSKQKLFGVAIAGPEFTENHLPGTLGTDYVYPTDTQRLRYFASHGLTLIRLPVLWERIQPTADGPLSAPDVAGIEAFLAAAAANGEQVILDLHNFGQYYGTPLRSTDAAKFANLWQRLSEALGGRPGLFGYELMNEPHDLPGGSASWADLAQIATNAIRESDRSSWILVPGYGWQNAQFWPENNPTLSVRDPAGRVLYAAHEYFDRNGSGTYAHSYEADETTACVGVERLQPFLQWLADRDARGIMTEYGVPDNDPRWLVVLDRFLAVLDASPRILGGTYWPAGPWWGNDRLSVEPIQGRDRPQAAILFRYPSRR